MPTKIITLDDHFATGEPTVQLVSTWGRNGRVLREATSLHKVASTASPALDYIKNIQPEPGKSIVLVVGLGGSEHYGCNRNGDSFPEFPVKGKIASDEVLTKHYQTYDKANVFEHHVNSDPAKAIGRVKKAFWNPTMHRVELVEDFVHAKAPHLLEKIAAGEYPSKSMGCRIKHDVCTNCGNKARTRAEYCDHLKYAMSRIDAGSGLQNAALNPSPVFFDSSWVLRPADRTGYMLKKVAHENAYDVRLGSYALGEEVAALHHKAAEIGKGADIEKLLRGEPVAAVSNLDKGDASLINKYVSECGTHTKDAPHNDRAVTLMISYKPSEAVDTANSSGLPLGIREIISYFMQKLAPELGGKPVSDDLLKSASDHLGLVYSLYAQYPRFYAEVVKEAGLDAAYSVNPKLLEKLASSPTTDYLERKYLPEGVQNQRPKTDLVSWTDPNTGQQFQTNYGIVQKTHDALIAQGLKQKAITGGSLLGGGALLGGAAYGMRHFPGARAGRLATGVVGAGLGLMGAKKLLDPTPIAGPKIVTDQGETISGWTEMTPTQKFGFDYVIARASEAPRKLNPQDIAGFFEQTKQAEIHDELSPYLGPSLEFDRTAALLGKLICAKS